MLKKIKAHLLKLIPKTHRHYYFTYTSPETGAGHSVAGLKIPITMRRIPIASLIYNLNQNMGIHQAIVVHVVRVTKAENDWIANNIRSEFKSWRNTNDGRPPKQENWRHKAPADKLSVAKEEPKADA